MNIYDNIKNAISFEEFLIYSGYEYAPKKAKNCFVNKKQHDIIFLNYDAKSNSYTYYSLTHMDRGDIIDFVRNRLNGYYLSTRDKHDEKQALNVLKSYANIPEDKKIQLIKKNIPKIDHLKSPKEKLKSYHYFSKLYNLKSLEDTGILNLRYINNKTIESPILNGCIFNCSGVYFKDDGNIVINENVVNIAFLYHDIEAREVGMQTYYIDKNNKANKFFVKDSSRGNAVWITKHLKNKTKKLFIAENSIDAISHHELNGLDQSYRYLSTGGQITENQIQIIQALVDKYRYHVELGNDFDRHGQRYNLDIISALGYEFFSTVKSSLNKDVLKLDIKFHQISDIELKQYLTKHSGLNKNTLQQIKKSLLDEKITHLLNAINKINKTIIKDFEKNQIKKESFSIAKKSDYSYTINIPNRAYQIAELNNVLINEFKLNISLKIPQSLDDWNQDLKNTKSQELKEVTLKKNTNIKI